MIYHYDVEQAAMESMELSVEAFVDTLALLSKLTERYLREKPNHLSGFCSWAVDQCEEYEVRRIYDTVEVLRRQPSLAEVYGESNYVCEEDGPTSRRLMFVHDLHVIIAHLLREAGLAE